MKTNTPPTYTESLKVMPKALIWVLAIVTLISIGLPVLLNWGEWNREGLSVAIPSVGVAMLLIWWFVLTSRIKLHLDAQGVTYQFWPLPKKQAHWEELKGWWVRKVSPIGEFGGWGLRWGFGQGWGYVTTSSRGLQLVFKNDKRVVISTEQPEALKQWLEQWAPEQVIETA